MSVSEYIKRLAQERNVSEKIAAVIVREMLLMGEILIDADWNVIKTEPNPKQEK